VEDLNDFWPEPEEEDPFGIFFTIHDIVWTLPEDIPLAEWLESVILAEKRETGRIDFIFCNDEYILDVNRTHLDHDFYTDIITFPFQDDPVNAEIYISIERVRENADQLGIPFEEELCRVMVHGVLHLCGYDDHQEDDIAVIRAKENLYLAQLH
jgi:rRNA maturation RNase YbeY